MSDDDMPKVFVHPREARAYYQSILSTITYRPGWRFELQYRDSGLGYYSEVGMVLETMAEVPDRCNKDKHVTLADTYPLGRQHLVVQDFLRLLHERIMFLENHERLEWLQINGHPIWEPHDNTDASYRDFGPGRAMFAPYGAGRTS